MRSLAALFAGIVVSLVLVHADGQEHVRCLPSHVTIDVGDCAGEYTFRTCASNQTEADEKAQQYAGLFGDGFGPESCEWVGDWCEEAGGDSADFLKACKCEDAIVAFSNECTTDDTCDKKEAEPRWCCSRDAEWMRNSCTDLDESQLSDFLQQHKAAGGCFDENCVLPDAPSEGESSSPPQHADTPKMQCLRSNVSIGQGQCTGDYSFKVCAKNQEQADMRVLEYSKLFGEDFSTESCSWVSGWCNTAGGVATERVQRCDCADAIHLFSDECSSDDTCHQEEEKAEEPRWCCSSDEAWLRTACDAVEEDKLSALLSTQRQTQQCFDERCVVPTETNSFVGDGWAKDTSSPGDKPEQDLITDSQAPKNNEGSNGGGLSSWAWLALLAIIPVAAFVLHQRRRQSVTFVTALPVTEEEQARERRAEGPGEGGPSVLSGGAQHSNLKSMSQSFKNTLPPMMSKSFRAASTHAKLQGAADSVALLSPGDGSGIASAAPARMDRDRRRSSTGSIEGWDARLGGAPGGRKMSLGEAMDVMMGQMKRAASAAHDVKN